MITLRSPFKETTVAGELTSLIDIIFLLLIFFMLTATFKKNTQHIPLEMPLSTSTRSILTDNLVVIEVNAAGHYFLEGKINTEKKLYNHLKSNPLDKNGVVLIRGHENMPFQSLINIYDIFQDLGITRFGHEVKTE